MSRIGRMPIAIPAGVTVDIAENNLVTVKGPKGTISKELPHEMKITSDGKEVLVERPNDLKKMKSLHGLTRSLLNNMVIGVTDGFEKKLELNGVGYRVAKSGNKLTLNLGFSHSMPLISVIRRDLNLTRARVSSMQMKSSAVRLVRLVRSNRKECKKWFRRRIELNSDRKNITDFVTLFLVLQKDRDSLYSEATSICMLR